MWLWPRYDGRVADAQDGVLPFSIPASFGWAAILWRRVVTRSVSEDTCYDHFLAHASGDNSRALPPKWRCPIRIVENKNDIHL